MAEMDDKPLFDVVAVNIRTQAVRLMAERKTKDNAEAFIRIAIMRRGVDKEFYKAVPHPSGAKEGMPPDA